MEQFRRLFSFGSAPQPEFIKPATEDELDEAVGNVVVSNNHRLLVEYFNNCEVKVNYKFGKSQRTYLHLAAGIGSQECVAELLARGAEVDAADGQGNTALHLAARNGHKKTMLQLIK
eukprot:Colp12_sorted_trinity150504_noHs@20119